MKCPWQYLTCNYHYVKENDFDVGIIQCSQVLSASGGQIIAVQNPALTLSGAASLASLASAHSGGGRVGAVPGSSNSALSPQPPPPPLLTITSQGEYILL